MKTMILRSMLIVSTLAFHSMIFSQNTTTPYSGSIIAGTDRLFLISIGHQESIKAKIISIDDNMLILKPRNGDTRKVDRSIITNIEEIPFGTIGTVGVGFGVPYGLLGFNAEIFVIPYISLTAGFGTTFFTGLGYNVGAKGYFRKPGPVWRPRISAYYGINGIYAEDFGHPDNTKYTGLTVGMGQLFLWQNHGFDFDLMYIVNSGLYDDYPGYYIRVKISVGYRYAF